MSNYTLKAKNKETGEIVLVLVLVLVHALDDFFGKNEYGYDTLTGAVLTESGFNQLYEEIK